MKINVHTHMVLINTTKTINIITQIICIHTKEPVKNHILVYTSINIYFYYYCSFVLKTSKFKFKIALIIHKLFIYLY